MTSSMLLNGVPMSMTATYRVVVSTFLLVAGDTEARIQPGAKSRVIAVRGPPPLVRGGRTLAMATCSPCVRLSAPSSTSHPTASHADQRGQTSQHQRVARWFWNRGDYIESVDAG